MHLFVKGIFKFKLQKDYEKQIVAKGNSQHKKIENIIFISALNNTHVCLVEPKKMFTFGSARNVQYKPIVLTFLYLFNL